MPIDVPNSGQVYRAGERLPVRDPWIEHLAYLMDGAIPIGRWSIGLDPLLGLIPGVGDLIGAFVSMVIIVRAVQAGVPRIAITRMMANLMIDTLVGSIPIFGDAFDFAFKANLKNLRLYEQALNNPRAAEARNWAFFISVLILVAGALIALTAGLVALARRAF
ncbi:MAG: DUF4112 domain-containing protein [Candidatus Solibacter sp.]